MAPRDYSIVWFMQGILKCAPCRDIVEICLLRFGKATAMSTSMAHVPHTENTRQHTTTSGTWQLSGTWSTIRLYKIILMLYYCYTEHYNYHYTNVILLLYCCYTVVILLLYSIIGLSGVSGQQILVATHDIINSFLTITTSILHNPSHCFE